MCESSTHTHTHTHTVAAADPAVDAAIAAAEDDDDDDGDDDDHHHRSQRRSSGAASSTGAVWGMSHHVRVISFLVDFIVVRWRSRLLTSQQIL